MIPLLVLASIPKTIDVVVLSKQEPASIAISEDCGIRSVRARGDLVTACDRRNRCEDVPTLSITCRAPAVLEVLRANGTVRRANETAQGIGKRRFGRKLSIRSEAGTLRIVTTVDLEAYVAGVVSAEMANAPEAALEAQAIATRTFALRAIEVPRHADAHVCDLTHCQVLPRVASEPIAPGAHLVDRRSRKLAVVFFHSTCGGRTVDPRSVWPDMPSLSGIEDVDAEGKDFCRKSPHHRWVSEIDEGSLAAALEPLAERGLDPGSLELVAKDRSFVVMDSAGEHRVDADKIHQHLAKALGFSKVKSAAFDASRTGRTFILRGRGLGHGVGMCQHGAMERAKRGATAVEILGAYFPDLEVAR